MTISGPSGDTTSDREERPQPPVRVVSARVSLAQRLRNIWLFRECLIGLTRKELKVKYKNSVLGFLWSFLNPATSLLVFYVVFQLVLRNGIPFFAIYLISGILVWNLFSVAVPQATVSIVANAPIVKKVAFPREILSFAAVLAALVHFFLQLIVLLVFLVIFKRQPAYAYLPLLIPALLALLMLSLALGVLLAAVNVKLRDVQHLVEIGLQVWFWATPIVYQYRLVRDNVISKVVAGKVVPASGFKHAAFIAWRLNPVTPIVLTFQRAIYGQTSPVGTDGKVVHVLPDHAGQWWYLWQLLAVIGFSFVLLAVALRVFGRLEGNFAEDL
ncbi:MAG: type transport system permease protein [Acidimicrobiaceae bacterium]|jgi:ABC-2 type transport system permease protein|nr:type transport system permease protein [Acidimicrobiaceae bacterium]